MCIRDSDDSYHIVTVDRQRDLLIEGTVAFGMLLASRMRTEQQSGEIIRPIGDKSGAKARADRPDLSNIGGNS